MMNEQSATRASQQENITRMKQEQQAIQERIHLLQDATIVALMSPAKTLTRSLFCKHIDKCK
jgi:23S rRNA pseudoU1915 N3-methylase RlmH